MKNLMLPQAAEKLLAFWIDAKGDREVPTARFIDPIALRAWIGDISVVKLHEGPKRFYVSLHGANVARHLGPDFNRKYLEDVIPPSALNDALAPYELSAETGIPTYSVQNTTLNNGLFKTLERMILPISSRDTPEIDRFLVWVAPIDSNSNSSSSIFKPFDDDELLLSGQTKPDIVSNLYLLSDGYKTAEKVA